MLECMFPPEREEQSYSFTLKAWRSIDQTVTRESLLALDSDAIFSVLTRRIRPIPFREYLKRYVHEKSGMLLPFHTVPLEEYQSVIVEAFRATGTPCSFTSGKTALPQAVRNWLTRDAVTRETVLLLGFGLYMTPEDVNAFLTRALHGSVLDEEDPSEAVCLYCYRHGYKFAKYRQLMQLLEDMGSDIDASRIAETQPLHRPQSQIIIQEDTALLARLLKRKAAGDATPLSRRRHDTFLRLCEDSARFLDGESGKAHAGEFSPRSLEKIFSAGIPLGSGGNLIRETRARLYADFARKRLSRQHIHRILSESQPPNRYDLLTLRFYLLSVDLQPLEDRKDALLRFLAEADETLTSCGFGEIYAADPFDAFLILCMLTPDPFGAYADVMEAAYAESGRSGKEEAYD